MTNQKNKENGISAKELMKMMRIQQQKRQELSEWSNFESKWIK